MKTRVLFIEWCTTVQIQVPALLDPPTQFAPPSRLRQYVRIHDRLVWGGVLQDSRW